ncbi:MAG: SPOR domain-containing protein [Erythrobacter sp.]
MTAIINGDYEELDDGMSELDLVSESSLPWLESDAEDDEAGTFDMMQVIGFVGLLLAASAVLVGLVWFVSNRMSSDALEPDGSVIAAPEGPIKQRPEDPGGKQFAGTGNVAPLVGEGGTPQSVVASPADKPMAAPVPATSETKPAPAADKSAPAEPAISGVGVQLAAYSSRERAEQGWTDLSRRSETLQGARHRVVEGKVDAGTVYRLQAVAADRAGADALCAALKREGLDCQVKR